MAAAIAIGVGALAAAIGLAHEHQRWYVAVLLVAFGASRLVAPWFPPDLEGERPSRPGRIHLWLAAFAYATIAAAAGLSDRAPWLGWAAAFCFAVTLLSLRGGGVDGRVARYLKGTSRFGAELDSLADFLNFGVAPALILYFWAPAELGRRVGSPLVFAVCASLRLARFNVMIDDPDKPAWAGNFFVGIPAPMPALSRCCCRSISISSACRAAACC